MTSKKFIYNLYITGIPGRTQEVLV